MPDETSQGQRWPERAEGMQREKEGEKNVTQQAGRATAGQIHEAGSMMQAHGRK